MKHLLKYIFFISVFGVACKSDQGALFTRLTESQTGVDFRNILLEDNPDFNIVMYPYFYNGAGVAAGDINNDGLTDLFFTGNMVKNRLFLNKGKLKFEDITAGAGVSEKEGWCTGVTMADVNTDGWLDIYVCRSGLSNPDYRRNLLFINNHDNTFAEQASVYGIDDAGYTTQASFFDYDLDGDLDLFLINQSSPKYSMGRLDNALLKNTLSDSTLENKLFRNDGGKFTNVTRSAGISSNALTFSLGISTADVNQDGWPDIYVANDFNENDYYYLNNKQGGFERREKEAFNHFSQYSMGVEVNDYNNDGMPDILTLDMLSEGNYAQKMHMGADNYNRFQTLFSYGFLHQYMKNTVQRNNGDGTFSEVGQQLGVSNTDWSWSPLMADFDNDGWKDIFISNGYKHDNTNMQFIKFSMDHALKMEQGNPAMPVADYISHMPGILLPNYIFKNTGNESFENKVQEWGLEESFDSHGAIYADLDNDGDLDLITNNTDAYAGIYENNTNKLNKGNYLTLKLLSSQSGNKSAIGAKVWLYAGEKIQYQEHLPVRGYQSSVDTKLHFGLGDKSNIDSIRIVWPDRSSQLLTNVKANQLLEVKQASAAEWQAPSRIATYFEPANGIIDFAHRENEYVDFNRQYLLNDFLSRQGPCIAKADVNSDGLEDIFVGGAKGSSSSLFLQQKDGRFKPSPQPAFQLHSESEDVSAVFADFNKDGAPDLYVGSGGYEYEQGEANLRDRLYLNNGKGSFSFQASALPDIKEATSTVQVADVDGDGDKDIFTGTRCIPGQWPLSGSSHILINDGKANFSDKTDEWLPDLRNIGMVTCAAWSDIDKNGKPDLIIAGEYLPVMIFMNKGNKLAIAGEIMPDKTNGFWSAMHVFDADGDGDDDIFMGNLGYNTQFRATVATPATLRFNDYDGNGIIDPIFHYYINGESYPAMPKDDITAQIPSLNKRFLNYDDFAKTNSSTLFEKSQLTGEKQLTAYQQASGIFMQEKGKFVWKQMPPEVQYSPIYAATTTDVNADGLPDLLLFGNNRHTRIKYGEFNANFGQVLINTSKGWAYVPQWQSGLSVKSDVRSATIISNLLLLGNNNQEISAYRLKSK